MPAVCRASPAMALSSMPARLDLAARLLEEIGALSDIFPENPQDVIPGAHTVFCMKTFLARMKEGGKFKGCAISLFNLQLGEDAIAGVAVSPHDVAKYRADRFSKLGPRETPEWEHPVTVAVTPEDISRWEAVSESDGRAPLPLFRKISMDVMLYAFLEEMWARLPRKDCCVQLGFWKAARHLPVDFVFFDGTAELEKNIYVASIQITEDFRRGEEVHAPRAWHLCKLWARGRELQQNTALEPSLEAEAAAESPKADDGAARTAELLSRVEYGRSCDYVDKQTRRVLSRTVSDALVLWERVTAAGVGDLLDRAGAEFGPRSPLGTMTKLVKLSQITQATAAARKVALAPLLRRTIEVMFLRLRLRLVPEDEGFSTLSKTELPRCVLIADLLPTAMGAVAPEGEPESVAQFLAAVAASVPLQPSALEELASGACKPSARAALSWAHKLLMGHYDAALKEIVHQNSKTKTSRELLQHGKLEWDAVRCKLTAEAEAEQRKQLSEKAAAACEKAGVSEEDLEDIVDALADALAGRPDAATAAASPPSPRSPEDHDAAEEGRDVAMASAEKSKQERVDDAREAHIKKLIKEYFRFAVRPALDGSDPEAEWRDAVVEAVQGYFDVRLDGVACHGWIFDPASDCEPKLGEGESLWARYPPLDKVLAERFFKAAGQVSMGQAQASFAAMCFTRQVPDPAVLKLVSGEPFDGVSADHLNIIYKEPEKGRGQRRSRTALMERAVCFLSKAAVAAIERANGKRCGRRHFTSTSTWSDTLVQATQRSAGGRLESPFTVNLETKSRVLGVHNLLRGEDADAAEASPEVAKAERFLLHQEKVIQVWRDVLHHYAFSTLCTASPGSGDLLLAAFDLGIPAACLCKNQAHEELLRHRVEDYAREAIDRRGSLYFKPIESFCEELEIDPADLAALEGDEEGKESGASDGEDAEDEDAASDEEHAPAPKKKAAVRVARLKVAAQKAAARAARKMQRVGQQKGDADKNDGQAPIAADEDDAMLAMPRKARKLAPKAKSDAPAEAGAEEKKDAPAEAIKAKRKTAQPKAEESAIDLEVEDDEAEGQPPSSKRPRASIKRNRSGPKLADQLACFRAEIGLVPPPPESGRAPLGRAPVGRGRGGRGRGVSMPKY